MNTLKDTLNDLIMEIINDAEILKINPITGTAEVKEDIKEEILEEYTQRIINELNIKKYLQ